MRLGGGEFDPGGWSQLEARYEFLVAAAEVAPQVLEDLKETVYPEFIKIQSTNISFLPRDLKHEAVMDALNVWAVKFKIQYDWVLKIALRTMGMWHKSLSLASAKPLSWFPKAKAYWEDALVPEELTFEFLSWLPAEESRSAYRKRTMADFNRYLDEVENAVEERGYVKTKEVRNIDQFKWLAMWWFGSYDSFQELAYATYVERQTVTLAIQRAAVLCGLSPPRGEQGRPGSAGKPAK